MRQITKEGNNIYSVISEPGDATRYDFFVYEDNDEYSIMPRESNFIFPQKLNYYNVVNISDEKVIELSELYNCNPHTLKECINTILELREKLK